MSQDFDRATDLDSDMYDFDDYYPEEALEALEGLFEKNTWMGGYSVYEVLKLILEQSPPPPP